MARSKPQSTPEPVACVEKKLLTEEQIKKVMNVTALTVQQ